MPLNREILKLSAFSVTVVALFFAAGFFRSLARGEAKDFVRLPAVLSSEFTSSLIKLNVKDYTQTAMDPTDDCTVWYVGDYIKKGASYYSSRIGAFRMPGCGKKR